jgi:hypothetical protein
LDSTGVARSPICTVRLSSSVSLPNSLSNMVEKRSTWLFTERSKIPTMLATPRASLPICSIERDSTMREAE